jgi:hypothetical protein
MSMDPFIHRLVERLLDRSTPMSRNRHFHTFETAEGKRALRISRRLQALARDVAKCRAEGGQPRVTRREGAQGEVKVEVHLERLKSSRVTTLEPEEFDLLCGLAGVRAALAKTAG